MAALEHQVNTPDPHPVPRLHPHSRWIALAILPTLAAFLLYVPTLGLQGLWFDEALSTTFASRSLPALFHTLVTEDIHPPLYYLLLHFWMLFAGESEWAVRFISAACTVLLVPLAFAITREVWGHSEPDAHAGTLAALGASSLVATSPFLAYYAQETRMYAMAAMLALAAVWLYLRTINRTQRAACRSWALWILLVTSSLYTLYFSAFILPAFLLHALFLDHKRLRAAVVGTLLAGGFYLPWVWPAIQQMLRMFRSPDYWVTTRIDPISFLRAMWGTFLPSSTARWGVLLGAAAAIGLVLIGLRSRLRWSGRATRFALVVLSVVSPLALAYVAVAIAPKFAARYAIIAAPPLYVALALMLYSLLHRLGRWGPLFFLAAIVPIVMLSGTEALQVVQGRSNARDDARGLATYLSQHTGPEDAILLVENAPYALQHYYQGSSQWYGLHVGRDYTGAAGKLNEILHGQPARVWLVLWHYEFADPTDMVVTELNRVGREITPQPQFLGYRLLAFEILERDTVIAAAPSPQVTLEVDFQSLRLLGFDRWQREGGQMHYVLYWQAIEHLTRDYSFTWLLHDAQGNEYLRHDQALSTPYFLPPVWPVGVPIRGRADLTLPADLPEGQYRVSLQVFDPATRRNLDWSSADDAHRGQLLPLETIDLTKSDLGPEPTPPAEALYLDIGGGLQLLGFDVSTSSPSQGETVILSLWWRNEAPVSAREPVALQLVDIQGQAALQLQFPILFDREDNLGRGQVNRAVYAFTVPPDLPAGEYYLEAGARNRMARLVTVRVSTRERQYVLPPMQHIVAADFGPSIALVGYDLSEAAVQTGATLTATLYWKCQGPVNSGYKVSVQLLVPGSPPVSQHDAVPARWTRPTTAWLPGEVITDEHELALPADLPAGDYTLIAVLYDERSGERVMVQQGGQQADHAVLTLVQIHR